MYDQTRNFLPNRNTTNLFFLLQKSTIFSYYGRKLVVKINVREILLQKQYLARIFSRNSISFLGFDVKFKSSVSVYRNTVSVEPSNSTETLFLPNYRTETEILVVHYKIDYQDLWNFCKNDTFWRFTYFPHHRRCYHDWHIFLSGIDCHSCRRNVALQKREPLRRRQ